MKNKIGEKMNKDLKSLISGIDPIVVMKFGSQLYGTDTEKVRDILLSIAEENDDVVKGGYMPKPVVLFRAFGDSSLDFELRVFLHNVDSRLSIISDLNFAIDKAFREEGIEIPFPQRDLHVKSLPEDFSK